MSSPNTHYNKFCTYILQKCSFDRRSLFLVRQILIYSQRKQTSLDWLNIKQKKYKQMHPISLKRPGRSDSRYEGYVVQFPINHSLKGWRVLMSETQAEASTLSKPLRQDNTSHIAFQYFCYQAIVWKEMWQQMI